MFSYEYNCLLCGADHTKCKSQEDTGGNVMCALDREFNRYLKDADQDEEKRSGELVGGMAEYLYNHWNCRLTVILTVCAYLSLL